MLRLIGEVTETERKLMDQTDPTTGEVTKVMMTIAYVLDGRWVRPCIVDLAYGEAPREGESVDAVVQVTPSNNGRFNGINWRLLRPAEAVAAPSRAA